MHKNNLDISSTGTNIELSMYYESDSYEFQESAERINDSVYIFHDFGSFNVEFMGDVYVINNRATKKQLYDFLDSKYMLNKYINDYTKKELIYILKNMEIGKLTFSDLYYDKVKFKVKKGIHISESTGYSQGDCVMVIHNDFSTPEYIHNVFWDSKVYANLKVADREFDLHEKMDNPYEYDKDEFESIVKELDFDESIESQIIEMIPQYLDYKY